MKYLNILLSIMMIYFIVVQYNDPDGPMWALIYAVPAIWAALAGFRLKQVQTSRARAILGVCVLGAVALTISYWPTTPNFWVKEVYWETETAREGMGMMIATAVLLIASATILFTKRS